MIYGYCRVSRASQSIDRQITNILREYPDVKIFKEKFTGTKVDGRKEFNKLLKIVVSGDVIVFDSVSRMSRNAHDGVKIYFELFEKGIDLVFLKEKHINTATYKNALNNQINMTGTDVDFILDGVNKYLKRLAEVQITLAFDQAEKEVMDLRVRTSEGLREAKARGSRVGNGKGDKLITKKSIKAKEIIKKYHIEFDGTLEKDEDVMKLCGVSRNSYYKYKRELKREMDDK